MSDINDKRQAILDTATRLFYAYGYHAVGIDRVIAEAGVAKMTMYKYFASKMELISAVLNERDCNFCTSLFTFANSFPEPIERLRAVFIWHDRWFNENTFNGCMFINAAVEYPDPEDDAHLISKQHKESIQSYLLSTLKELLPEEKIALRMAGQLLQIIDGAIVTAQVLSDRKAALTAWSSASSLLKSEGVKNTPSF